MSKRIIYFVAVVASMAMCCACNDYLLNGEAVSMPDAEGQTDEIVLDAFGHTFTLPVSNSASIEDVVVTEGDFLFPVGKGALYVEQNDDAEYRTAHIVTYMADGSEQHYTLNQPPVSRASSSSMHRSFYRHHALGYSYDALGGDYCDLSSVRCQVLNRAVIDYVNSLEIGNFVVVNYEHQMYANSEVYTSLVDYLQHTNFYASGEAKIMMYTGEAISSCSIFEDGVIDTYILHDERIFPCATYSLDIDDIVSVIKKYPHLLTSSFRTALAKLSTTDVNDWKSIDDFIAIYGTHVVYATELGARIDVDIQVETKKFEQKFEEKAISENAIATLFKTENSSDSEKKNYKILRDCRCKIDVLGGDLSKLDAAMGMSAFSNENTTSSMFDEWMNSIYFNDNDLENSNAELINMEVLPIWELITDSTLAKRVEARVMSDAAIMQHLLGNRNLLNARFPYPMKSVTCRIGNDKRTFNNPAVVDVIVAGRHVATICTEYVPEITVEEKVQVVYPIYEGRVKLTDGYCIYKGTAYEVDWRHNQFTVTNLGKVESDGNLYLSCGALSATSYENLTYQEGHPILGCERPGGIGVDGKLAGEMVKVEKHFGHFYLQGNTKKYTNLPGWDYSTANPAEAENYSDYFESGYKNRMIRRDDYIYIYNTTEIGYEQ